MELNGRIVLLADGGPQSWAVAHALRARFGDVTILVEDRVPRGVFLRRRLRRLGLTRVIGQVLFHLYGQLAQRRWAARRREILERHGLDVTPLPPSEWRPIGPISSPETLALLQRIKPAVVAACGTSIIGAHVLRGIQAPFINIHSGITPAYRGIHGGYWALASGDRENCGVTIHLIDPGIDTGEVLFQTQVEPSPEDSLFTLVQLQFAAGIPLLLEAVQQALDGRLAPYRPADQRSALWTHPTLLEYLRIGLLRHVW